MPVSLLSSKKTLHIANAAILQLMDESVLHPWAVNQWSAAQVQCLFDTDQAYCLLHDKTLMHRQEASSLPDDQSLKLWGEVATSAGER